MLIVEFLDKFEYPENGDRIEIADYYKNLSRKNISLKHCPKVVTSQVSAFQAFIHTFTFCLFVIPNIGQGFLVSLGFFILSLLIGFALCNLLHFLLWIYIPYKKYLKQNISTDVDSAIANEYVCDKKANKKVDRIKKKRIKNFYSRVDSCKLVAYDSQYTDDKIYEDFVSLCSEFKSFYDFVEACNADTTFANEILDDGLRELAYAIFKSRRLESTIKQAFDKKIEEKIKVISSLLDKKTIILKTSTHKDINDRLNKVDAAIKKGWESNA